MRSCRSVGAWICCALLFCHGGVARADEAAKPVDYAAEIKPLLTARCAACHGAETQKSGFRVDTAAALIQGGDTGEAIVPGKPDDSLLVHAITGTNGVTKMPPKDPRLTDAEINLIKRWIEQGAKAVLSRSTGAVPWLKSSMNSSLPPLSPRVWT